MGILRHSKIKSNKEEAVSKEVKKPKNTSSIFSATDAAFLINKLRQANYTGAEFEQFYQIMAKLTKLANSEKE